MLFTSMKKISQGILLLVLGTVFTGCASNELSILNNNDNGNSNSTTVNSDANLGLIAPCPEGMKAFSNTLVYFCYPSNLEVDVDGLHYFIYDPADDETLVRELALATYEENSLQEHLAATYVNTNAANKGVTCDYLVETVTNGKLYTIIGYPTGDQAGQDLESVEVCRDTKEYAAALEELTAEAFFEGPTPNGFYLIINGDQESPFGEYTADFLNSLRVHVSVESGVTL